MGEVDLLSENNFGDTRSGGMAGPMGLFIILLLAAATVFLIRNMNARLRRLPDRFPAEPERDAPPTEPIDEARSQARSEQAPPPRQDGPAGVT